MWIKNIVDDIWERNLLLNSERRWVMYNPTPFITEFYGSLYDNSYMFNKRRAFINPEYNLKDAIAEYNFIFGKYD